MTRVKSWVEAEIDDTFENMEGFLPNTLEIFKDVIPAINPNGVSIIKYKYEVLYKYINLGEVYQIVSKYIQGISFVFL